MRIDLADAYAIPARLQEFDAALAATISADGHAVRSARIDHHRIFLLLYYFTTLRWLAFAETAECAPFFNRLLVEFCLRYERYVFDPVIARAPCQSPQWQTYFSWGNSYRRRPDPITRTVMIFTGAHAHIRHDLRESIASVFAAHPELRGARTMEGIMRAMLSPPSDAIFSNAAADFVREADTILPEVGLSFGRRAACLYFTRNTGWWMPRLQGWRAAAWSEAVAQVEQPKSTALAPPAAGIQFRA